MARRKEIRRAAYLFRGKSSRIGCMKEIERRVKLTQPEMEEAMESLRKQGASFQTRKRLIVDFSDDMETRERTVMVRVNNGKPEVVVKSGVGHAVEREEADVQVANGLAAALHTMALLGYVQASYGFRTMYECELDGIEYSFRVARNHADATFVGVLLEVELKRAGEVSELDTVLQNLGLKPLTDDEFTSVIHRYHAQANGVYEHSDQQATELEDRCDAFMNSDE